MRLVTSKNSENAIDTASQAIKAARGTKRVCQACEVRFYDLARDPIVCPSCGGHNVVETRPLVTSWEARPESAGKASWRSKPLKRPRPALPVVDHDPAPDIAAETSEEAPGPTADNELVLEEDSDEGDVTKWVDPGTVEEKEL